MELFSIRIQRTFQLVSTLNHGARCIFYPGETFLGLFHGGFIGQFDVLVSSIPAKVR